MHVQANHLQPNWNKLNRILANGSPYYAFHGSIKVTNSPDRLSSELIQTRLLLELLRDT